MQVRYYGDYQLGRGEQEGTVVAPFCDSLTIIIGWGRGT